MVLAEHVVRHTAPGSDHWPGLALVLTNEIRLARLNDTEAVWEWLEAGFRAHTQGAVDTDTLTLAGMSTTARRSVSGEPTDHPDEESLLPIEELGRRLRVLIGRDFPDVGADQERNRGTDLHRMVCEALGYSQHSDNGQFPDVPHQLLEVKLQTSPTVDLGLVSPDSSSPVDVPRIGGMEIRHCDVRYAVFGGHTTGARVTVTNLILTTGECFYSRFVAFGGKVLNKKLQIPLPRDFFT